MNRFPFYAYPNLPHSFYASPVDASRHHHHRPPAPSPVPTTRRSVHNVPVFDSTPSQRSSSPLQSQPRTSPPTPPSVSRIDPSCAATTIQSHFRGFCVRRHRPLLHLRSIAKAREQLNALQAELERPEFPLKVRSIEKERLKFSENVMAIILRLDAIEGSLTEVRNRRKGATKMAIKLQDALDAIVMQKEEIDARSPTANIDHVAPNEDSVLLEQSQELLCDEVNMVQGEAYTDSKEGTNEKLTSAEDDVADVITMQKDKFAALNPTADDNGAASDECSVLLEQFQESVCPEVSMVQGEGYTDSKDDTKEILTSAEDDDADVIMMHKDNVTALNPSADDNGVAPDEGSVLLEQFQESDCPEVNMVRGAGYTESEEAAKGKSNSPEEDFADKYMPNLDKSDAMDMVAEGLSLLRPQDAGQQSEAGSGYLESIHQVQPAKGMYDVEDMSHVIADDIGGDATHWVEEEVNKGINALHLNAHKNDMDNDISEAEMEHDTYVDDMLIASHGSAERESSDHTCTDIIQEENIGLSEHIALRPGTPTAVESSDYSHSSNAGRQGPPVAADRLTEGSCSTEIRVSPSSQCEKSGDDEAHKNLSNSCNEAQVQASTQGTAGKAPSHDNIVQPLCEDCKLLRNCSNFCNEARAQASTHSMQETESSHDNAIVQQLSEDCRLLKSLVGKLLVQNKAQSKILCTLSDRLELLEHQQQLSEQRNQQKMREKRKLKKGSKRSVKCRNCE